jgi:ABC-type lipoprotein export system ATPase subunit
MNDAAPVLSVHAARLPGWGDALISFRLRPGELGLVACEGALPPLADACEGLCDPDEGQIRFRDAEWRALSPDKAAAARARIGRVFAGPAWVSNLDLDENVTIRVRHHGLLRPREALERANELARRFGLDGLPTRRLAGLDAATLARAQWVRALLGAPDLLLLERPEQGVDEPSRVLLAGAVRERCDAGGAALWITADPRVWGDAGLKPVWKCRILADQWVADPSASP